MIGQTKKNNRRELTLILGGARSGKSRMAEMIAKKSKSVAYVATAFDVDDEMLERIEKHRAERPNHWEIVEVGRRDLGEVIAGIDKPFVIIDCLSMYVASVMEKDIDPDNHMNRVIEVIAKCEKRIAVVSNEVGLGLVPTSKIGRDFRDVLGRAHQEMAKVADNVYLMVAGLPLMLKGKDPLKMD